MNTETTRLSTIALLGLATMLAQPVHALTPAEVQKLLASDGAANDNFGMSVRIDGDTVVVGSVGDDDNRGAAYVFIRSGTTWTEQAKLTASDRAMFDEFGRVVAISGDTVVVGAWHDDDKGTDSGSAYVFTRSGTNWTQQAKLTASDGAAADEFGIRVAVDGDTALIGAICDDTCRGATYVFTRSGAAWAEQAKLVASDRVMYDSFGGGVAIDGDTAVIAAYQSDARGGDSGAAYVFTRSGTTWAQQAKLTASDGAGGDFFGSWVDVGGDTALIGAFFNDANGSDSGAAYVFTRSGATWTQQAKLTASDGVGNQLFGNSVSLDGDTALIGAEYGDATFRGAAYLFTRTGTTWTQQAKLAASDGAAEDYFGVSVAISGGKAVIGALFDDDNGTNSGSAYIFDGVVSTNVVPTVTIAAPTEGALFPISTGLFVTADITDPNAGDTHVCTVNWGDGSNYGPEACSASANGFAAGPHTFAEPGVYTIFATVTDSAGAVADDEIIIVVYDPSGGFVTGGGWIDSPESGYAADPGLAGKASFGFVSKYKHGATVPDGSTQFVFQASNLNFHSTAYEWLVVAGGKVQFKGVGTINGQVGYGFLIFATDAESTPNVDDADAFRIKIWNTSNLDALIYDNLAEQRLSGGSIVIHTGKKE
jgi:hypothetical protein